RKTMDLPSAVNCGDVTGRSSVSVRMRDGPPATGTTASRSSLYALNFGSLPRRYASIVPSGLHANGPPSGPSNVVSFLGVAPARASTTNTSEFLEWSMSPGTRVLSNAIHLLSGDHSGLLSS